jgi:hypothetical protein
MKKNILLLIALITFLIVLSTITFINAKQIITKDIIKQEREYDLMWTKAICNDEYCQDYEIRCKDNKVVSKTPITGAILIIDSDWKDPRDTEFRELMC